MKRHGWQSVISILTGIVFLTACGNRKAVSAEPQQHAASNAEETVLVYRVCEEIIYNNRTNDSNVNELAEALRFEYEYNADGMKAQQTGYDSYGNSTTREYLYTFDTDRTMVNETLRGRDGSLQKQIDYQYDADGEMTERAFWTGNNYMVTQFYDTDSDYPEIAQTPYPISTVPGSSEVMRYISYCNGAVAEFATAQYDSGGNRIRETIYFADGSPLYSYTYDYDAAGNITRETVYDADGVLLNTGRFEYCYDEYGNILEQRRYLDETFTGMTKYHYIQVRVPKIRKIEIPA